MDYSSHNHNVGRSSSSNELHWMDGMVQHHIGASRMCECFFDIGLPGAGAFPKAIWRDQAKEIKAMGLWRRAWFPLSPSIRWRLGVFFHQVIQHSAVAFSSPTPSEVSCCRSPLIR